jgi:glycosyltransferase 2 family protein
MQPTGKMLVRARTACLLVAIVTMFFVVRRIHAPVLAETVRTVKPAWFLVAVMVYGLLFLPAAWRWHLALRLTGNAVSFGTSLRLSLIGHFFYTILFGAAGGDAAKSVLYSRRYDQPLPEIFAASSLDRLLGFGGLTLFAILAFTTAVVSGGLGSPGSLSLRWPVSGLFLVLIALVLGLIAFRWRPKSSMWVQFTTAFFASGRKLMASPKSLATGLLCGFAVQLALSGVLALNLQAVSHTPVPWLRLAWTFPVISIVSALPITIAGLGARDSAALVLFGFCNVAGADAVAASLLTATVSLLWTVVGGGLLWREVGRKGDHFESEDIPATMPG